MARTVPSIAQKNPGDFLTGAVWNANVKAMGDWLLGSSSNGVPRFRGHQGAAQSLADNTWTGLTLDTEDFDSDNGHSTTTSTSRYTVQVAGTYAVTGSVGFASNTTGLRGVRIAVSGVSVPGSAVRTPAGTTAFAYGLVTCCQVVCSVGDYIEVQGNQTSGAALNTNVGTDVACSLGAYWISG
ncbi:hypothetical protein ACIA7S_28355 [Streptomyces sp. NPDC051643]|uniref:hypothetical protein n=1 Tax=Streptomyces sp. NPDC051643 TaxID=3365665 RepID=UPI003798E4FD